MSWRRLLGFRSRLRSDSPGLPLAEGSILPWALPLAGFTGTQPCIRSGSTPIGSPASGNPRPTLTSGRALPNPLMGLRRSFPTGMKTNSRFGSKVTSLLAPDAAGASSPSLQRIDGADASPSRPAFEFRAGRAPCLRFRTVREKR
jgi:hypothetical protein